MNRTDRRLRHLLKNTPPPVDSDSAAHFDRVLRRLTADSDAADAGKADGPARWRIALRVAAAALLAALVILPNVSPVIAQAMEEIPLLGSVVRVIVVNRRQWSDDYHHENVEVPQISGDSSLSEPIRDINADVQQLTDAVIAAYEKEIADVPDAHIGLDIQYSVVTNTEDWFTLRLTVCHIAGSGTTEEHFYHIDKRRRAIVRLSDLFSEDFDYVSVFTAEVKAQMEQRMAQDGNAVYWIYPDNNTFFGFYAIDPDTDFYFNEAGELTLVFEKYEVGPGSMGTPEFTIPSALYEPYRR